MTRRRDLCGAFAVCLAALAPVLAPPTAGAAEPDPRLASNPALGRIAADDPAEAGRLLDDIDRLLRQPRMRGGPFGLDAAGEALLAENPLLGQAFAHDPAAAVALLERMKAAGGGKGQ